MTKKLNCILLIDDDEPTNFMSSILLEEAGCTNHLQIEESGKKALEYLSKKAGLLYPQLILLDLNMPAMNGWEFLEEYKKMESSHHPETVIIVLTTSINPDDKLKAENMPRVAGFEHKPLTGKMIQSILEKYFSDNGV